MSSEPTSGSGGETHLVRVRVRVRVRVGVGFRGRARARASLWFGRRDAPESILGVTACGRYLVRGRARVGVGVRVGARARARDRVKGRVWPAPSALRSGRSRARLR